MPELPDLAVLADALDATLTGRRMKAMTVRESLVMRGTPAEIAGLQDQLLGGVSRRGKFLTFSFERDQMVMNLMLTGRLGLAATDAKPWPKAAAVLEFGPRGGRDRLRPGPEWLIGASWLPRSEEAVELRYRDPTRMGKIYLLPAGVDRAVAGWEDQGPDIDSPALTFEQWRQRITRHNGELKNVLRNQGFVAGIGNAYSDEILWAARLAPFRKRSTLAAAEVDALYGAAREVISWAINELHERVPPKLEVEQRDFLRVHGKGGEPCPRCGTTISEVSAGGFVTNWCRSCQR